jgi:hypothetical protein
LEDISVRPLAFLKGSSVKGYDESNLKEEEREYVYVMLGEMLVFYGTKLVHGSPVLSTSPKDGESRKSLSIYFDFKRISGDPDDFYWKERSGSYF